MIGNGDVTDVASARRMMQETGCDLVMIGRGALGNPWIFEQLAWAWENGEFDAGCGGSGRSAAAAQDAMQEDAAAARTETMAAAPKLPDKPEKIRMMLRHFDDVCALKGEYTAVREMRKHVGWYLKGLPGAAAFRGKVNQINDADALREAIRNI